MAQTAQERKLKKNLDDAQGQLDRHGRLRTLWAKLGDLAEDAHHAQTLEAQARGQGEEIDQGPEVRRIQDALESLLSEYDGLIDTDTEVDPAQDEIGELERRLRRLQSRALAGLTKIET